MTIIIKQTRYFFVPRMKCKKRKYLVRMSNGRYSYRNQQSNGSFRGNMIKPLNG